MADNYTTDTDRNDSTARTLAVVGIIIAIMAFAWAYKADNKAKDAEFRADSSMRAQEAMPTSSNQSEGTSIPAATTDATVTPAPAMSTQP